MPPARCRRQRERPKASGVVLDGQVVDNDARRRLCPVSQYVVVASHHFSPLSAVRETGAGIVGVTIRVVATAVAATSDRMASASLGDFAVAVAAVNIDDLGGRRRRMVV